MDPKKVSRAENILFKFMENNPSQHMVNDAIMTVIDGYNYEYHEAFMAKHHLHRRRMKVESN